MDGLPFFGLARVGTRKLENRCVNTGYYDSCINVRDFNCRTMGEKLAERTR